MEHVSPRSKSSAIFSLMLIALFACACPLLPKSLSAAAPDPAFEAVFFSDLVATESVQLQWSWHAVGIDPDDNVYVVFGGPDGDSMDCVLFQYNSRTGERRSLGRLSDAAKATGTWAEGERIEKGHTTLPWLDGRIYIGTMGFHDASGINTRSMAAALASHGARLMAYVPAAGKLEDLGRDQPGGVFYPGRGFMTLHAIPEYNLMAALTVPHGDLLLYDPATGQPHASVPGVPEEYGRKVSREIVHSDGKVYYTYTSGGSAAKPGHMYHYDIESGQRSEHPVEVGKSFWNAQVRTSDGKGIYLTNQPGDLLQFHPEDGAVERIGSLIPESDRDPIEDDHGTYDTPRILGMVMSADNKRIYSIPLRKMTSKTELDGKGKPKSLGMRQIGLCEYHLETGESRRIADIPKQIRNGIITGSVRDSQGNMYFVRHAAGRNQYGLIKVTLNKAKSSHAAEGSGSFQTAAVFQSGSSFIAVQANGGEITSGEDAAAVINTAIKHVAASGGGTLQIAAGSYPILTPLVMRAGVRLVGEGGLITDERPADDYPTVLRAGTKGMFAVIDMVNGIPLSARLEHMVIDGAGMAGNGIRAGAERLRIRDCVIKGATERGVWMTAGRKSTMILMTNCLIDQQGRGVGVEISDDPAIKMTAARARTEIGIFKTPTDHMIYRCRIRNAPEAGAIIKGGSQFLNNHIEGEGMKAGLIITAGSGMATDNIFDNFDSGPAVRIIDRARPSVAGNLFRNITARSAVLIETCPVTISGNTLQPGTGNTCEFFAELTDNARFVTIADNAIEDSIPASNRTENTANSYVGRNSAGLDHLPAFAFIESISLEDRTAIDAMVAISGGECTATAADGTRIASGTSASEVIQAAINAVAPKGKATIFVQSGIYTIQAPIRMAPGIQLAGEGGMWMGNIAGTTLRAAQSNPGLIVDMTEAHDAQLTQIGLNGNDQVMNGVKAAGRSIRIANCYLEGFRGAAVLFTNGEDPAADAYAGMALADSFVRLSGTPCLVQANPLMQGAAPSSGIIANCRLKNNKGTAVLAGGPGWKYAGNHATSNSPGNLEIKSSGAYINGNYFDVNQGRVHISITAPNSQIIGNYIVRNTRPRPDGFPKITAEDSKMLLEFLNAAPPTNCIVAGNIGSGHKDGGEISNLTASQGTYQYAGNLFKATDLTQAGQDDAN